MKTNYSLVIAAAAILITAKSTQAQSSWNERFRYEHDGIDVFPSGQASVDLFGTYADRDRFGRDRDRGGGGAGLNYFFNRYMGIGADSYLEEWRWPYRANGSAILRLPLQGRAAGLAPYGIAGGGREFKYAPQYTGHVGGGMEFKLNPYTGIFADARRVFPDKTGDYTLVRAGLRFGF
jgi:hypothetical protein